MLRERTAVGEAVAEDALDPRLELLGEARSIGLGRPIPFDLEEDVVLGALGEGRPELPVRHDTLEATLREELVRRDREGPGAGLAEEAQDAGDIAHAEEHHRRDARQSRQLERRLGDDAERALAADEELPQVQPGVVLLQRTASAKDLAVREDDLEAEDPLAREAVANDLHAARVGGDVAADSARSLRREVDRPREPVRCAVRMNGLRDRAGLDAHGRAEPIHLVHPSHLREREDDLAVRRDGATGEPGAAARRHDRDARFIARSEEARDFVGRSRERDRRRRRRNDAGPVAPVLGEVGRLLREEVGRKAAFDPFEERSRGKSHRDHA